MAEQFVFLIVGVVVGYVIAELRRSRQQEQLRQLHWERWNRIDDELEREKQ